MTITSINLPKMSLNMEEGTIVSWLVKEGQQVQKGDALFEVQTDKAISEVEANKDGYLREILVQDGKTVAVGTAVGVLVDDLAEQSEELKPVQEEKAKVAPIEEVVQKQLIQIKKSPNAARLRISPVSRKLIAQHDLDPTKIDATGPLGRIVLRDVYREIDKLQKLEQGLVNTEASLEKVTAIRKAIAQNLTKSVQEIPQFTITKEVAVEKLEHSRIEMNTFSSGESRLSMNDFLIKAIADTIAVHPKFNNYYIVKNNEHYIQNNKSIHIGLAVATEKGLFVPVIRNVEAKSLVEIMQERKRLIEKTKQGKLSPEEMSGATFTISSLGSFNIKQFTAIINPPESGILAVGKVEDYLYLEQGEVKSQKRLNLTASFDHRLVDGADGAQFMNTLEEVLIKDSWYLF
ncbi:MULTISPECIES: dihydrolipoamide acetyltransferase family protein [Metasolibacillus]|uniref:dihydrolipoamide acetyltransferase family protein n=1 Tax=Metasolibacillus TaxID=2703677 RepID=UPI000D3DB326|nr:dihydrolipoamide acetyltransferase family protein [Metasolibacillus fluoroglycofenilyticus]